MWDLKSYKKEKIGSNIFDIGHWICLPDMRLRQAKQKQKSYWEFIKLQSFCKVKETSNAKMQHIKWEEIFVNKTSNKESVSKIHKANINVSILNTNYPTADGQKTWMDFVSVKTSRWPPDTRTDTQRHPSSGKCKPKPQWDVTWQPTEWLKLTTQETTDVGEAMEKGEPPYTPRGHVNRCSYCGKQCGESSRS